MTSDSRVEAVARAIDPDLWGALDEVRQAGAEPSVTLNQLLHRSHRRAQAAIEANDSWLKEQGWEMAPAGSLLASRRASDPPARKGLGLDWVILDEAAEVTPEMWDELRGKLKGKDQ